MVQSEKQFCMSHSISQEPYIIWFSFMVHICKMIIHICKMIIPTCSFFIFSKLWFFGLLGDKRAKNSPKWQKILLCSISQETYIVWSSFVVCKFKIIISSGVFFHFFKILIFQVVRRVEGQKMAQNEKKLCCALYLRNHTSCDLCLWYTCVTVWYPQGVLHLFQIFIFGVSSGVKWQKVAWNDKNSVCLTLYLRNCMDFVDFGTLV